MDNSALIRITAIERDEGIYCFYYGDGDDYIVESWVSDDFVFRDTCGKFQIGDTINFVKIK